MNLTVLISLGRHPKSGRLMLSPNDARALAVAHRLSDNPRLVHVGEASQQQTLRQYLGLGFAAIDLIEAVPGQDICGVLIEDLRSHPCDVLLTGERAQGQDDTGLVPYILADRLQRPLLDRVLSIDAQGQATQFLPKGQRRVMALPAQCIATVSENAPLELEYVARRARQGVINVLPGNIGDCAQVYHGWQQEPKQPGRTRLSIQSTASGWDRFAKRMNTTGGGGQVLKGSPDQGAAQVLSLLRDKKLVP